MARWGSKFQTLSVPSDPPLDLLNNLGQQQRVYDSFTSPAYSNVAYDILGKLIENASGKTYSQYLEDTIFQKAQLHHTSIDLPSNRSVGFIPAEPGWWATSLGIEAR
jgi:CubicO group peptidase (beta-lactamase class C family)